MVQRHTYVMRPAHLLIAILMWSLSHPLDAAVRGTVIDSDGKAIAGARVSLFTIEAPQARRARLVSAEPESVPVASTQTDEKGNFSLESPKTPAELRVFLRGFTPEAKVVEPDEDIGAVLLGQAEMKTGQITSAGKPVAGAVVSIQYAAEYVTRTDENGRYEAPDPKRAQAIVVIHPDHVIDEEIVMARSGMSVSKLRRSLTRGSERAGRVVAANGESPVAGAAITVDGWPVATSAEDGTFKVSHLPQRWTMLTATKEGWIGQRASGEGPLHVKLARAITISGRILDAKTKMPVPGATILLGERRRMSFNELSGAMTDAKGVYSLSAPAGSYNLMVSHPAYRREMADAAGAAGQKVARELTLEPFVRVSGFVHDEEKRPVSGAVVRLDDTPRGMMMRRMLSFESATSAPDGRFHLKLGAEGELRLRGTKKGLPAATSEPLQLVPGERKTGVLLTIPSGVAVAGRVTNKNGDPLSGVVVTATETQQDGRLMQRFIMGGPNDRDDEAVRTDAEGNFSLRVREGTFDFSFKRDGYAARTVRAHQVKASGAEPIETSLEEAVEISGRVVRDGIGVEGVRLFAMLPGVESTAMTGADGSFTLGELPAGPVGVSLMKEEDFIETRRSLTAPEHDVVIELPSGGRISGRVLEKETRTPVTTFSAGVSTSMSAGGMVRMAPPQLRSFTSEDGSFVLENVPFGAVNLVVSAPGFAGGRMNLTLEEGKPLENVEVEIDRGVKLTGKVTGPNGSALSDASVFIRPSPNRPFSMSFVRTTTDTNGEYTLEALSPGEETIEFSHPKHLNAEKTVTLKDREQRLDVRLESGMKVAGMVVTEGGAPVAEAEVVARGGSSFESARSDSNGAFELESIAPGRYTVTASRAGFADGRVEDFDPASGAPLRIVLRTGGTIWGRVSGLTDEELSNVMVDARGAGTASRGAVDSSGNYRIEGVSAGTVRVSAQVITRGFGGGKSSPAQTVELTEGGSQQVDIRFESGTAISGRVLRNRAPLAGAMVQFAPRTAAAQTRSSASTDGQGYYTVTGLEPGDYNVAVVDLERFSPYSTTYQVSGSATFDIEFSTSSLRGRVIDSSSGEGVAEANVQVRPATPDDSVRMIRGALSDVAGNFTIENVPPGSYLISASKDGFGGTPAPLTVSEAPVDGVEVKLARNDGVTMKVVDARDGRAINGAVIVRDAQDRIVHEARGMFGSSSQIQLPLPPGSYTAAVYSYGYALRNVSITSPSSPTVALSRGGALAIEGQQSSIRRGRLLEGGRVYPYQLRPNGVFEINPRPGITTLENVAPGSYTLVLLSPDETSVEKSVQIVVQEGGITRTEL